MLWLSHGGLGIRIPERGLKKKPKNKKQKQTKKKNKNTKKTQKKLKNKNKKQKKQTKKNDLWLSPGCLGMYYCHCFNNWVETMNNNHEHVYSVLSMRNCLKFCQYILGSHISVSGPDLRDTPVASSLCN